MHRIGEVLTGITRTAGSDCSRNGLADRQKNRAKKARCPAVRTAGQRTRNSARDRPPAANAGVRMSASDSDGMSLSTHSRPSRLQMGRPIPDTRAVHRPSGASRFQPRDSQTLDGSFSAHAAAVRNRDATARWRCRRRQPSADLGHTGVTQNRLGLLARARDKAEQVRGQTGAPPAPHIKSA